VSKRAGPTSSEAPKSCRASIKLACRPGKVGGQASGAGQDGSPKRYFGDVAALDPDDPSEARSGEAGARPGAPDGTGQAPLAATSEQGGGTTTNAAVAGDQEHPDGSPTADDYEDDDPSAYFDQELDEDGEPVETVDEQGRRHIRRAAPAGTGDILENEAPRRTGLPDWAERRRARSATGTVLTAFAFGLQQVFETEREQPAIIMETSGDPPRPLPVQAQLEQLGPRQSSVTVRSWLLVINLPGEAKGPQGAGDQAGPQGAGDQAGPQGAGDQAGPQGAGDQAGPAGAGDGDIGGTASP